MGYKKAANPITFLKQIHEYHMVPDSLYVILNAMAAALPYIDLFAPAHSLESLAALEDELARPRDGHASPLDVGRGG
jgi:hypothetical protein